MIRSVLRIAGRHWRGELPLAAAVLGILVGGRVLMALVPEAGDPRIDVPVALFDAGLLVWQAVGATRAALAAMAETSDALPAWGSLAAVLAAVAFAAVGLIDRLVPPPPPAPIAAVRPLPVTAGRATLAGEIDFSDLRGLEAALAGGAVIDTLVLTSDGGLVYAARALALVVERHGLATRVEGRCASACVLVFLAGEPRSLSPGAELGFHGYRSLSRVPTNDIAAEEARDRARYEAKGIDPEFIELVFATPPAAMWFPTEAELRRAGVLSPD